MLLHIPEVLTLEQVAAARRALDEADGWMAVSPRVTSQPA